MTASRRGGLRESGTVERFDLSAHTDLLQAGENVLAVALINLRGSATSRSRDLFFWLELGDAAPVWHTNFRIQAGGGETLVLSDASGAVADSLQVPAQEEDRTYGRAPDGSSDFAYFFVPTPRRTNDTHTSAVVFPPLSLPAVSPAAGKQTVPVDVAISVDVPFDDVEIRYTMNGDAPTIESQLYDGPLHLEEDTVIRTAGFLHSGLATHVVSRSYYGLSETTRDLQLPVFAISLEPDSFRTVQTNLDATRSTGTFRPTCKPTAVPTWARSVRRRRVRFAWVTGSSLSSSKTVSASSTTLRKI